MVRYLNNRRDKSRGNRQQSEEPSKGGQQPGQAGGQGNQYASQRQSSQGADAGVQPVSYVLGKGWKLLKGLLTYQPSEADDTFSLGERRSENPPSLNLGQNNSPQGQKNDQGQEEQRTTKSEEQGKTKKEEPGQTNRKSDKPIKQEENSGFTQNPGSTSQTAANNNQPDNHNQQDAPPPNTAPYYQQQQSETNYWQKPEHHTRQGGTPVGEKPIPVEQQIHFDLEKNLTHIKRIFNIPLNKGFTIREFLIGFKAEIPALILFTEGLSDKNIINKHVLEPLMSLVRVEDFPPQNPIDLAKERLVSANQVEEKRSFIDIIEAVLTGSTALFIHGSNSALLIETKGWEHRGVGRPQVENVVRGPQEGFNELLITNVALVRSRLRTENLVSEMVKVGRLSKADVAIMYLKDIANPAVIQEVHKRLETTKEVDYIPDTGILEQFIEDNPFSLAPQMLTTERPDRVAAYLSEGHVAILMSSTPFALIVPATFWALLHSPEDSYVRWPYGGLMRVVRVISLLIAIFLPAVYIAIVNYHHSMIPPDLLFAIAAARERIPFPAVFEIVLMEFAFELIREAGIRIPSIIGTTIGIVGALILGQAAVQANLISPLVIIIIAVTGLSSFAIPNYSLAFNVRLIRFGYIAVASAAGFFGVALGMVLHMGILVTQKSFGVPLLSPAAPYRPSKDTVLRGPLWVQEKRPSFLRPLVANRQPPVSRAWDPWAKKRGE